MNSFKKSVDINIYQSIDKLIQSKIEYELNKLESIAEIPDYKKHIQDRKKGILECIFPNFDSNMNIIDEQTRYITKSKTPRAQNYKTVLDKIIKKRIYYQLDNLYDSISNSKSSINNLELHRILSQISDREVRLGNLLEDFDKNMDILKKYKENSKSFKSETQMPEK